MVGLSSTSRKNLRQACTLKKMRSDEHAYPTNPGVPERVFLRVVLAIYSDGSTCGKRTVESQHTLVAVLYYCHARVKIGWQNSETC